MDDVHELQWIAARTFDCMFIPESMDLAQHPRMYPLTNLIGNKGSCNLICVSPSQVQHVIAQIQHARDRHPCASFCVVVPMTRSLDSALFRGWTVLTEWGKSHYFHTQDNSTTVRRCKNRVRAYFLPPQKLKECNLLPKDGHSMTFVGYVNGEKARVMLDSGASDSFLSLDFSRRLRIHGNGVNSIVELGGGEFTITTTGSVRVSVRFDNCHTRWSCEVVDLNTNYDLILGRNWLSAHRVLMDFGDGAAHLHKGNRRYTLYGICKAEPSTVPPLLTAMQLKRKLRSGAECLLAQVTVVEGDVPEVEFPLDMKELATEFHDVFQSPPAGLLPARNIAHAIPLEPGA